MGATLTTVADILKDWYIGPIQEQLNQEVYLLEHFQQGTVQWAGKQFVIPIHKSRNTGVGWRAESDTLPTATNQGWDQLTGTAAYLYGRFQVTRPMMKALANGGEASFASWMDAEMEHLRLDVTNNANRKTLTGGRLIGFLRETKASTTTADAAVAGGLEGDDGADDWIFDGDFDALEDYGITLATETTWVPITLYRMDTYATGYTEVGSPTGLLLAIKDYDKEAGTITISVLADAASDGITTVLSGLGDSAIAVVTVAGQQVDSADDDIMQNGDALGSTSIDPDEEIVGFLGNLGLPTHFSVNRTTASGTTTLQSRVTVVGGAGDSRVDLGRSDIDLMNARIINRIGMKPDCLWMNELQKQMYKAILVGTVATNFQRVGDSAGRGDAGILEVTHDGVPIKSSRHVPNGMVLFESTSTWMALELAPGEFVDEDGAILSRVSNKDVYEGYYAWYCQLVCTKPAANGILVGASLTE